MPAATVVVFGNPQAGTPAFKQQPTLAIDLPLNDPLVGWAEALAVKKGEQELLNFLNAWVTARKADRWLTTTRDYWFESLEWTRDLKR